MINEQVSAADGSEHDTKSLDNNRLASEKKQSTLYEMKRKLNEIARPSSWC